MSMCGNYVAIPEEKLNEALYEGASLSRFVFDEANDPFITRGGLEQAWDAFRHLFQNDIPELLGEDFLEDADLGEGCCLIAPSLVASIAGRLATVTPEALKERFDAEEFQSADFYWENVWKEAFEDILSMFTRLAAFFKAAARRGDTVFFYVC